MVERGITMQDIEITLRGGAYLPAHFESDAWRYRVEGRAHVVVIEIEDDVLLITTWRRR